MQRGQRSTAGWGQTQETSKWKSKVEPKISPPQRRPPLHPLGGDLEISKHQGSHRPQHPHSSGWPVHPWPHSRQRARGHGGWVIPWFTSSMGLEVLRPEASTPFCTAVLGSKEPRAAQHRTEPAGFRLSSQRGQNSASARPALTAGEGKGGTGGSREKMWAHSLECRKYVMWRSQVRTICLWLWNGGGVCSL